MKKQLLWASIVMFTLTIASCSDTNSPGKSDDSSVPALARKITNVKADEANKFLIEKGFTQLGVSSDEGHFVYPDAYLDENEQEKGFIYKKEWVMLDYSTAGTSYVQEIEGNQHLLSASDAFAKFKSWNVYLRKNISKPSLHIMMIIDEESVGAAEPFVFGEGWVYEHYREFMLAQLDALLNEKRITVAEYEEQKAPLMVTYEDFERKLTALSLDKEFSVYDQYVEITNAAQYQGIYTVSLYSNSSYGEESVPANTLLEHMVRVGDVWPIIQDYILE